MHLKEGKERNKKDTKLLKISLCTYNIDHEDYRFQCQVVQGLDAAQIFK